MIKSAFAGRLVLAAPVAVVLSLTVALVIARINLSRLPWPDASLFALPILPLVSLQTLRRYVSHGPIFLFAAAFLLIIHGVNFADYKIEFYVSEVALRFISFIMMLFAVVIASAYFYSSYDWHCAFSAIGIPPKKVRVLFAARGAIIILRAHIEGVLISARLQHGGAGGIINRFAALRKAVIPFFYASAVKLEASLISQQQRGLDSEGIIPRGGKVHHLRGWLSVGLTAVIVIYISLAYPYP